MGSVKAWLTVAVVSARLLITCPIVLTGVVTTFPEICISNITKHLTVYKKGSKDVPGNYRPISVLPVLGKIFEKIVSKQLMEFLEANNVLQQH